MNLSNMFSVSVLLHQDGDSWVAQCLEFDVAAQGKDEVEAKNRFLHTFASQILFDLQDKKDPLASLPSAPQSYFDSLGAMSEDGPALPIWVPQNSARVRAQFLKKAA